MTTIESLVSIPTFKQLLDMVSDKHEEWDAVFSDKIELHIIGGNSVDLIIEGPSLKGKISLYSNAYQGCCFLLVFHEDTLKDMDPSTSDYIYSIFKPFHDLFHIYDGKVFAAYNEGFDTINKMFESIKEVIHTLFCAQQQVQNVKEEVLKLLQVPDLVDRIVQETYSDRSTAFRYLAAVDKERQMRSNTLPAI